VLLVYLKIEKFNCQTSVLCYIRLMNYVDIYSPKDCKSFEADHAQWCLNISSCYMISNILSNIIKDIFFKYLVLLFCHHCKLNMNIYIIYSLIIHFLHALCSIPVIKRRGKIINRMPILEKKFSNPSLHFSWFVILS
jgi:hypothetical protein